MFSLGDGYYWFDITDHHRVVIDHFELWRQCQPKDSHRANPNPKAGFSVLRVRKVELLMLLPHESDHDDGGLRFQGIIEDDIDVPKLIIGCLGV